MEAAVVATVAPAVVAGDSEMPSSTVYHVVMGESFFSCLSLTVSVTTIVTTTGGRQEVVVNVVEDAD